MTKYEYQIVTWKDTFPLGLDEVVTRRRIEDRFNTMGELGWEMVAIQNTNMSDTSFAWTVWKRERP